MVHQEYLAVVEPDCHAIPPTTYDVHPKRSIQAALESPADLLDLLYQPIGFDRLAALFPRGRVVLDPQFRSGPRTRVVLNGSAIRIPICSARRSCERIVEDELDVTEVLLYRPFPSLIVFVVYILWICQVDCQFAAPVDEIGHHPPLFIARLGLPPLPALVDQVVQWPWGQDKAHVTLAVLVENVS